MLIALGVAQGDDLQYVFSDLWGKEFLMSSHDIEFSKNVFVPLFTNFAKTGYTQIILLWYHIQNSKLYSSFFYSVPTPKITDHIPTSWTPFNKNRRFLRIGTILAVDSDYRADATRFWNEEIPAIYSTSKINKTIVSTASAVKDEL